MTSSGEEQAIMDQTQDGPSFFASSVFSSLAPLTCSCIALALVFWGLVQLDLPVARYMRSVTVDYPWARDQILIPWMAFTSWAGDWIGEGKTLALLSVLLLAVGWMRGWANLTVAGWQSLLAHGVAALFINVLKHLIGRPRPRLVHSGGWVWMPSMQAGLDSFPSGHAAASFAVATVLAKRFPAGAALFFVTAGFVGLSRVIRGSHFSTDIAGGIVFGVLAGTLCVRPIRQWRISLTEGFLTAATGMVYVFALFWVLSYPPNNGWDHIAMAAVGGALVLSGCWYRLKWWRSGDERSDFRREVPLMAIALGLALMSRSWLVIVAVASVSAAHWFRNQDHPCTASPPSRLQRMIQESVIVMGILLMLFVLWQGAGAFAVQ